MSSSSENKGTSPAPAPGSMPPAPAAAAPTPPGSTPDSATAPAAAAPTPPPSPAPAASAAPEPVTPPGPGGSEVSAGSPDGTTSPAPAAAAAAEPAPTPPGPAPAAAAPTPPPSPVPGDTTAPGDGTTAPAPGPEPAAAAPAPEAPAAAAPTPPPSPEPAAAAPTPPGPGGSVSPAPAAAPAPAPLAQFNYSEAMDTLMSDTDEKFIEYMNTHNIYDTPEGSQFSYLEANWRSFADYIDNFKGRNWQSEIFVRGDDGRINRDASIEAIKQRHNEAQGIETPDLPPLPQRPALDFMHPSDVARWSGTNDAAFLDYIRTHHISNFGEGSLARQYVRDSGRKLSDSATDEDYEKAFWEDIKSQAMRFNKDSTLFKKPLDEMIQDIHAHHDEYQKAVQAHWEMAAKSIGYESEMPFFISEQDDLEIKRMLELVNTQDEKGILRSGQEVSGWIAQYINAMPKGPHPAEYMKDGKLDEEAFAKATSEFKENYKGMKYREHVRPDVYSASDSPDKPYRKLYTINFDKAEEQQLKGNMFIPRKGPNGRPIYDNVTGKQIQDIIIFKNGKPVGYHIMDPKDGCAISKETLDKLHEKGIVEGPQKTEEKDFVEVEYVDNPEKAKEYLEALKAKHGVDADKTVLDGDKKLKELELEKDGIQKDDLLIDGEGDEYGVNLDGMRGKAKGAGGNILVKVPRRDENKNQLVDEEGRPVYDLLIINKDGQIVGGLVQEPPTQTLLKQKDREELQAALADLYKGREAELKAVLGLTDQALAARREAMGADKVGPEYGGSEDKPIDKEGREVDSAQPIEVDTADLAASTELNLEALIERERAAAGEDGMEHKKGEGLGHGAGDMDLTRNPAPNPDAASLATTRGETSPAPESPAAPGGSDDSASEKKPESPERDAVKDVLNPAGGEDKKPEGRGAASTEEVREAVSGKTLTAALNEDMALAAGSSAHESQTAAQEAHQDAREAHDIAERNYSSDRPIVAPNPADEEEVDKVQAANRELIEEAEEERKAEAGVGHSFGETAMRSVDGKPKVENLDPALRSEVNAVSGGLQNPPKVEPPIPAAAPARTQEQERGQAAHQGATPAAAQGAAPKPGSPADHGMARPSTPPSPTAGKKPTQSQGRDGANIDF